METFLESMKRSGSDLQEYPVKPMEEETEGQNSAVDEEVEAKGSKENSNDSLEEPSVRRIGKRFFMVFKVNQ